MLIFRIDRLTSRAKCAGFAIALLGAVTPTGNAMADDPILGEVAPPAVQNRKYRAEHEFLVGAGLLPTDPYTKGATFDGGYAWHMSDLWAAEARFSWVMSYNSSIRDKLEQNFGIDSSRFFTTQYLARVGALWKPFYGKLAFLNNQEVYGEFFFSLHGVLARVQGGDSSATDTTGREGRFAFGGAPGVGLRGYLNRYLSVRVDFNWLILATPEGDFHFPVSLSLALAFTTRSDS